MPRSNGNLRFTDKGILVWNYRQQFLHYTEQLAPEVLESLKAICPKWKAVINDYAFDNGLVEWLDGSDSPDPETFDIFRRGLLDYHLAVKDRYKIDDPKALPDAEEAAWANCIELRNVYAEFLETYGLMSEWLRSGLFRLLGDLAQNPRYFNSLRYAYSHAWWPAHGDELNLRIEGWKIEESWQEFEARARQMFDSALQANKAASIKYFREECGYTQTTKPRDYSSVKWLVLWTVKRQSKAEILELIDKENEANSKTYDLKSLEKAFRALKEYDLPVRVGN